MGLKTLLAADWIFPPGAAPLKAGALLLEEGRILEMGPLPALAAQAPELPVRELSGQALLPGLVNSHTHLELASFQRLSADQGFVQWIRDLVAEKVTLTQETVQEGLARALKELLAGGTAHVAEVASTWLTAETLGQAPLSVTLFREYLGLGPEGLAAFEEDQPRLGPQVLPACHAVYSTSRALLHAVSGWTRERALPTTIHLAESNDEMDFFHGRPSAFPALLKERGFAKDRWPEVGAGPTAYLDGLSFFHERTLAVHLAQATAEDLAILAERGVNACLCPSSNQHLLGKLPPVRAIREAGLNICLGTDSPVSGDSLNLFNEMGLFLDMGIPARDLLEMATLNGARALGLAEEAFRIEKGARPCLFALPCNPTTEQSPLEAVLRAGAQQAVEWLVPPGRTP